MMIRRQSPRVFADHMARPAKRHIIQPPARRRQHGRIDIAQRRDPQRRCHRLAIGAALVIRAGNQPAHNPGMHDHDRHAGGQRHRATCKAAAVDQQCMAGHAARRNQLIHDAAIGADHLDLAALRHPRDSNRIGGRAAGQRRQSCAQRHRQRRR